MIVHHLRQVKQAGFIFCKYFKHDVWADLNICEMQNPGGMTIWLMHFDVVH